jgi:hypothetical protein
MALHTLGRDLQRESGLASAAGTGEGEQTHLRAP